MKRGVRSLGNVGLVGCLLLASACGGSYASGASTANSGIHTLGPEVLFEAECVGDALVSHLKVNQLANDIELAMAIEACFMSDGGVPITRDQSLALVSKHKTAALLKVNAIKNAK